MSPRAFTVSAAALLCACTPDPKADPGPADPSTDLSPETTPSALFVTLSTSQRTVEEESDVILTASVASDAPVAAVDILRDGEVVATIEEAIYDNAYDHVQSFAYADNGAYTFAARAHDATGASAMSDPIDVVVSIGWACGPNAAPCASAACEPDRCLRPAHTTGFGDLAAEESLRDVALAGDLSFDTANGSITGLRGPNAVPHLLEVVGGIGFQIQGPGVAIWSFRSLSTSGAQIAIRGSHPAALVAERGVDIDAETFIDAAARGTEPGPGGYRGGIEADDGGGCAGGEGTLGSGGGAGFGSDGGDGAGDDAGPASQAGGGGLAADCDFEYDGLRTLRGGPGGGGGESSGGTTRLGGGGGGGVQITALGDLSFHGTIHVGGGGAEETAGNRSSGSGGGAGGAVFIEGATVTFGATAGLYANGGGGGSSSDCGSPGGDATPSLDPAPGGACDDRSGGDGAAGTASAGDGIGTGGAGDAGGGGGGGLGRIVINTLPEQVPSIAGATMSPSEDHEAFAVRNDLGE